MPIHVLIVDAVGLVLAASGFTMAFRQGFVRRLLGQGGSPHAAPGEDPLTYILRIAGMMIMVFGVALGIMVTLFNLGQSGG